MKPVLLLAILSNTFAFNPIYKNLAIPNKLLIKASVSNIAMHGMTDIFREGIAEKYFTSYCAIAKLEPRHRFYVLLVASIYHIRNDIGLFPSILLHYLWVIKPITSLIYLSFVHVPLHYIETFRNNVPIKYIVFLNLLGILITLLPFDKLANIDDLWWVWIVLGHIMVVK